MDLVCTILERERIGTRIIREGEEVLRVIIVRTLREDIYLCNSSTRTRREIDRTSRRVDPCGRDDEVLIRETRARDSQCLFIERSVRRRPSSDLPRTVRDVELIVSRGVGDGIEVCSLSGIVRIDMHA